LRTSTSISFSWSDGPSNGGGAILDYRISYAHESVVYTIIATGIT